MIHWTLKRMLAWLFGISFIGIIIFYAYFQARGIIGGPEIIIETPENGITATTSLIRIAGTATRAKALTLDGRTIFIDLENHFDERLLLSEGYNIIELDAKDNEGRETRKALEIIYKHDTSQQAGTSIGSATSTNI